MKSAVGLWIDHSQANIVMLSADGEKTEHIRMTDRQIAAKVRQHFGKHEARSTL